MFHGQFYLNNIEQTFLCPISSYPWRRMNFSFHSYLGEFLVVADMCKTFLPWIRFDSSRYWFYFTGWPLVRACATPDTKLHCLCTRTDIQYLVRGPIDDAMVTCCLYRPLLRSYRPRNILVCCRCFRFTFYS